MHINSIKNRIFRSYKKKTVIISTIMIVITILMVFLTGNKKATFETGRVIVGNIIEKVSVTGKVTAFQKADLGFEKGGTILKINFKVGDQMNVGDTIAILENSDSYASLNGAKANLLAEQARFSELLKGLRPEELSIEDSKLKSAQIIYDDSKTAVITSLYDSYIKTENSILNYVGVFFTNSQSVNPNIILPTYSYNKENEIENLRVIVTEKLNAWKNDLDLLTLSTSTDIVVYVEKVHVYLESIKDFMSKLSYILLNIDTGNSGLSQATINSYNVTFNSAMSIFNTAISSIATAESNYRSALSSLNLAINQFNFKKSGSSEEVLQIQQAKVSQAQANVDLYYSELKKKSVVAPFKGILIKVSPEIGEFVQAGQTSFSMISDKAFKIEVNVPEADIAKVAIANKSNVTLDSYGQYIPFPATVKYIDPAETIIEGVSTYKVTLEFDSPDMRIRSGMTANIDILTHEVIGALAVPSRAVIDNFGKKTIRIVNSNSKTFETVPVEIGLKGSEGTTEIISGVKEGQEVVTYLK